MDHIFAKKELESFFEAGEVNYYKVLLKIAYNSIDKDLKEYSYLKHLPHYLYIDRYNSLIRYFRQTDDKNVLKLAKIYRRAAHKIYYLLLNANLTKKSNKFLNIIECQS